MLAVVRRVLSRFFWTFNARQLAIYTLATYASVIFVTVALAHLLYLFNPDSAWAERLITPVRDGLEFVDLHWKAGLLILAPFFPAEAIDLVRRISKVAIGEVKIDLE